MRRLQQTQTIHGERSDRRGAIIVLLTVLLPVLLILGAFAVNLAWMSLIRTEIQIAADSAARAAGREFSVSQQLDPARLRAQEAVQQNTVGGRVLTLEDAGITFGESVLNTDGAYDFNAKNLGGNPDLGTGPGQTFVNAVQVDLTGQYTMASMPFHLSGLTPDGVYNPAAVAVSTQTERDIVLVLDRSGSMNKFSTDIDSWRPAGNGQAFYGSRWRELATAVDVFLDVLVDSPLLEQVGLATFSRSSTEDEVMTLDYSQISNGINAHTLNFRGGRTAVGEGIYSGLEILNDPAFSRPFATKTMIVMTDGRENIGRPSLAAATLAAETYGVTVHTITFSDEALQRPMRETAAAGGGQHFHAENGDQLKDIFFELARTLPTILTK